MMCHQTGVTMQVMRLSSEIKVAFSSHLQLLILVLSEKKAEFIVTIIVGLSCAFLFFRPKLDRQYRSCYYFSSSAVSLLKESGRCKWTNVCSCASGLKEFNYRPMTFSLALMITAESYFIYKLIRVYQPETTAQYEGVKGSLTIFCTCLLNKLVADR